MAYDPARVAKMQTTPGWSALTRVGIDFGSAITWDRDLLREPRVLVPIDVQACVVAASRKGEPMVRLPSPLSPNAPAGIAALQGKPFDPGSPRPAGCRSSPTAASRVTARWCRPWSSAGTR